VLKTSVQAWIYSFPTLAALDAQFDEGKIAIGEVRSLDAIADSEWADYWRQRLYRQGFRQPSQEKGNTELRARFSTFPDSARSASSNISAT
jgi:hypothetical protein